MTGFKDQSIYINTERQTVVRSFKQTPNTWQDFAFPIVRSRIPVANFPSLATFKGNLQRYTFAVNDYVDNDIEALHDYAEGTLIDIHLHGATNGVDITDRYIKYQAEITVGNDQYNASGIGVAFTDTFIISKEFIIPANTPDRTGFFFDLGEINIPDLKIGAQICIQFKRITASGTAPTNNPFIITIGGHYQQDTLGSRQETVK